MVLGIREWLAQIDLEHLAPVIEESQADVRDLLLLSGTSRSSASIARPPATSAPWRSFLSGKNWSATAARGTLANVN